MSGLCVLPTQSPDSKRKTIVCYGGKVVNNHIVGFPTGFYYTSFTTTESVNRATCLTVCAAHFLSWAHETIRCWEIKQAYRKMQMTCDPVA